MLGRYICTYADKLVIVMPKNVFNGRERAKTAKKFKALRFKSLRIKITHTYQKFDFLLHLILTLEYLQYEGNLYLQISSSKY